MPREPRAVREALAGVAGAALVGALFMPWTSGPGGAGDNAWELVPGIAAVCALAGLTALLCALTKGRVGFFRPDVSVGGAADILSVAAALAVAGLFAFGLPGDESAGAGLYLALGAACATFMAVGDYGPFRGAPVFPRLDGRER